MYKLAVIYDSGKRYIVPFSVVEKVLKKEDVEKLKTAVLKEVNKL